MARKADARGCASMHAHVRGSIDAYAEVYTRTGLNSMRALLGALIHRLYVSLAHRSGRTHKTTCARANGLLVRKYAYTRGYAIAHTLNRTAVRMRPRAHARNPRGGLHARSLGGLGSASYVAPAYDAC
eukprot:5934858-Pleurochrysis_carterae.AAC.1